MATSISRAKLIVETAEAERNLDRVGKSVDGVGTAFKELQSIVAGIAIGKLITDSLNLAARLDTLGQVTGIATANLRGFQLAVGQSGGNSERATDAISDLVKNIGEAANGSAELTRAFGKVGVSLDDLDKLSSQGILDKVVVGLAGIDDKATRSALQMKLMGEAVKTVDFRSVASGYATFTGQSSGYAAAAESARKAQDKMVESLDKLQQVVVEALKPISDLVTTINVSTDDIRKFVKVVIAGALALGSLLFVGKVVQIFRALYVIIAELITSAGGLVQLFRNIWAGLGGLITNARQASSTFRGIMIVLGEVGAVIMEKLAPAIAILKPLWKPMAFAAAAAFEYIFEWLDPAIEKIKEFGRLIGIIDEAGGGAGRGNGQAELEQRRKDAAEQLKELNRLKEVDQKRLENVAKFSLELTQQNQQLGESLSKKGFDLFLERQLVSLSQDRKELAILENTLLDDKSNKLSAIDRQIAGLQLERNFSTDENNNKLLDARISLLNKQKTEVENLYGLHRTGLVDQLKLLQEAKKAEENRLFVREQIVKSLQDENNQQQKLSDTLRGINQQIGDLDFAANLGKGSKLEQQIETIKKNAVDAARAAGNEFAGTFQDNGFLTEDEAQRMSDGLKQIADGYDQIASKQIAALTKSRETMTGLQSAVSEYVDKATNDAQIMANSFDNFVGGMEDAFANFVTTGKLDFKSLANSIIADLARIAVKKAIVAAIGGPLGSLFGFANGGPVQGATPIVVGERGPELFVPKAAGTIISNGALKGGASGGSSQPQQSIVNYNIQAVDAASFRSLVARDPSFIYAVTEQGRRSQPAARRIA